MQESSVWVDEELIHRIGPGLLVLLGVGADDTDEDAGQLAAKDKSAAEFLPMSEGEMNRSVSDIHGEMLVVSQFTLYGDTRKGTRPSFSQGRGHQPKQRTVRSVSCYVAEIREFE